ncbi:guanine deaminase [Spirochaetia bacterium]|nr:guanine deaminase [Spirochaetia bacterium]
MAQKEKTGPFGIRGTFAHTPQFDKFEFVEEGVLVCEDGKVAGLFKELPDNYRSIPVTDYSGKIIIPGMCDLHIHAPQYSFRGLGKNRDEPLKGNWFTRYAFPDESRYSDLGYARKAYTRLVEDLKKTSTTRLCFFATIHRPATELLMELLDEAGFAAYVGKVNMDRNSVEGLMETTEETISETIRWLDETADRYENVRPIITPRYTPSCTDQCSAALGKLAAERKLPVQSHLCEDLDEIEWVHKLSSASEPYARAYDKFGLFGSDKPAAGQCGAGQIAVMAHCVFPSEGDFELMGKRNVIVAHCPQSNLWGSGMSAPVMRYLKAGIKVGLGTDVAGGFSLLMNRTMLDAIAASRIYFAFNVQKGDPRVAPDYLSLANAFYLATKGGGALWGGGNSPGAGSFEKGYPFDAVVWDDSRLADYNPRTLYERVERLVSLSDDRDVAAKYIAGKPMYIREA